MHRPFLRMLSLLGIVLVTVTGGACAVAATSGSGTPVKAVEGLWAYTGLIPTGGKNIPVTGVILFKDGWFVQQSVDDGQPFEKQGAMAHAGPYGSGPAGVHMVAQQTIGISPEENPPLSFRRDTQHDISVERSGDAMKIVFGSGTGTVQTFKRIGPANGEIYSLEHGLLAFVDGYFVLVEGDEQGVVTGYGTFKHAATDYDLQIIRWAESAGGKTLNRRDAALKATFDGKAFTLADGRSFRVVPRKQ